jgi:N utilization substance protein B
MLKKRKTREIAMQTLFLWDATGGDTDAGATEQLLADGTQDHDVRRGALEMAKGTWAQREQIDAWVERLAPQWPPRRQPGVDRSLIRLAVWELTSSDTPPKVVIDEAIELAKQFSTEQSPAFVNGVLDAILKEKQALTQDAGVMNRESVNAELPPLTSES